MTCQASWQDSGSLADAGCRVVGSLVEAGQHHADSVRGRQQYGLSSNWQPQQGAVSKANVRLLPLFIRTRIQARGRRRALCILYRRPDAHQSRSGYWKGAMKAPLAPSMWIMISQPCSLFSFSAGAHAPLCQATRRAPPCHRRRHTVVARASRALQRPLSTARCAHARQPCCLAHAKHMCKPALGRPLDRRARTDGRVDALDVLKVARVGRAQDAHHADGVLVAQLRDLRGAGGASGVRRPQQSALLRHADVQPDTRHAAQSQGGPT